MPEPNKSDRLRQAIRASLVGSGSTSWMSPRRRWVARGSMMLSAICLGVGVGLTVRTGAANPALLPLLLGVGCASLGFLVYDVIVGLEILEKRSYESEMAVATEIQMRLFPRELPNDEGLSVAAYHKPAQAVGGDYYDVMPLGDGRYGIVGRMGSRRRLETGGVPVGMFSGSPYEQGAEFFGAGDRMVLYTDGVSDVGSASGELFTEDDLEDVVFSHRTAPVDELMRGILDQVYRVHGDQEQPDDITLLVIGSDAA